MRFAITICKAAIVLTVWSISQYTLAEQIIRLAPTQDDMTPILRNALESATDKNIKIVFAKGTYKFLPRYAKEVFSEITNHGNGLKKIIFPMQGFESVIIEGNGSEFVFRGQVAPFQFIGNKKVKVSDITLDWDVPFTFVGEVVAVDENEGWRDIIPMTVSHSWELQKGKLLFPNVDGFNYSTLGSTMEWDPATKAVYHGIYGSSSEPHLVEKRPGGVLRFHEKMRRYPAVGSLLQSKGTRGEDRYAPAFQVKSSSNITIENVTVHHALGMAFLFERSENITLSSVAVKLKEGSNRVISSTADATHFANCKGDILIEDSYFANMLDDGTNVHGTYVTIDKILSDHSVRVELMHFEQLGFEFAGTGDEIWFIYQPNTDRNGINMVSHVKNVNERFIDITFEQPLPKKLTRGDILENKTWNPTFTMRGTTIRNHRARNIVLKTPLKTVIENNNLSSQMSSILFRGESYYWYESGGVNDVVIRNNNFEYVAYAGAEHAVLYITPRIGETFNQDQILDRNIRFENNTIKTFDNRIVWADRVGGLVIKGNKITKTNTHSQLYPKAPIFEFVNSENVQLIDNEYAGEIVNAVKADKKSRQTLQDDGSIK